MHVNIQCSKTSWCKNLSSFSVNLAYLICKTLNKNVIFILSWIFINSIHDETNVSHVNCLNYCVCEAVHFTIEQSVEPTYQTVLIWLLSVCLTGFIVLLM